MALTSSWGNSKQIQIEEHWQVIQPVLLKTVKDKKYWGTDTKYMQHTLMDGILDCKRREIIRTLVKDWMGPMAWVVVS